MVSQLRVVQIRSCPNVDSVLLTMLNDYCNPFALQELDLDRCENVNDDALIRCLSRNHVEVQVEMQDRLSIPATKLHVDLLKWR